MAMTPKAQVRKMLDRLPDDASLLDIAESVYVLHRVERGREDVKAGRVYTTEQVREELRACLGSKSRGQKKPLKTSSKSSLGSPKTPKLRRSA